MDCQLQSPFSDMLESELREDLDDDVLACLSLMNHPTEAISKAKELKEDGNSCFRSKKFNSAAELYDKALQFLCVSLPTSEDDAALMYELGLSINLNIAACWLKLNNLERVIHYCDLALQFDFYNVKARYRRACAFLGLGKVEKARLDLHTALRFEPHNGAVLEELGKIQNLDRNSSSSMKLKGKEFFDPLNMYDQPSTSQLASERFNLSHEETGLSYDVKTTGPTCKRGGGPNHASWKGKKIKNGNEQSLEEAAFTGLQKQFLNDPMDLGGETGLTPVVAGSSPSICDLHMSSPDDCSIGDSPLDWIKEVSTHTVDSSLGKPMLCAEGRTDSSSTNSPVLPSSSNYSDVEDRPLLCFSQKGKHGSSLRLSPSAYESVLKGNSCEFLDKKSLCHMTVRVHKPTFVTTCMEETTIVEGTTCMEEISGGCGKCDSDVQVNTTNVQDSDVVMVASLEDCHSVSATSMVTNEVWNSSRQVESMTSFVCLMGSTEDKSFSTPSVITTQGVALEKAVSVFTFQASISHGGKRSSALDKVRKGKIGRLKQPLCCHRRHCFERQQSPTTHFRTLGCKHKCTFQENDVDHKASKLRRVAIDGDQRCLRIASWSAASQSLVSCMYNYSF